MSRESTLVLLGILIALSPFLGLPYSWLMWILPVLGLATLAQAVALRARRQIVREEPIHELNETEFSS